MADAKKPSIEEVLAACRKMDGAKSSDSAPAPASPSAESAAPAQPTAPKRAQPAVPKGESVSKSAAAAEKPVGEKKPIVAADAGKMSMADILAAARQQKSGAAAAPVAKSAATSAEASEASKSVATKPAIPKGDDAAKGDGAAKVTTASKQAAPPKDTGSILAAARKVDRPGPMSKEQAALKAAADPKKSSVVVPPKPEKPAYAQVKAKEKPAVDVERRGFVNVLFGSALAVGFTSLGAWTALGGLGLARFMFPNIRTEPPSRFKIGFPAEFPPDAVSTRFTAQFGIWVVNVVYEGQRQIVALKTVCTHLGCTPNWLEAEQKFKCPCHGSGFYKDGINFEGPAPRPLERYAIRLSDDGQLEVDKSKKFQQEMGQWSSPGCYVPV